MFHFCVDSYFKWYVRLNIHTTYCSLMWATLHASATCTRLTVWLLHCTSCQEIPFQRRVLGALDPHSAALHGPVLWLWIPCWRCVGEELQNSTLWALQKLLPDTTHKEKISSYRFLETVRGTLLLFGCVPCWRWTDCSLGVPREKKNQLKLKHPPVRNHIQKEGVATHAELFWRDVEVKATVVVSSSNQRVKKFICS